MSETASDLRAGRHGRRPWPVRVRRARYNLAQSVRVAWYVAQSAAVRTISGPASEPGAAPPPAGTPRTKPADVREAVRSLFVQDLRNIEAGLYPAPRDMDPRHLRKAIADGRQVLADAPDVARRRLAKTNTDARDLADERGLRGVYPTYYLQNFHYQTDGWLTRESARLYDTQVEVLFQGAADAMRRAALAQIAREVRGRDQRSVSLVDVACGTGRFLQQTLDALPRIHATGVDLSPAYVAEANERLAPWRTARAVQANAEALPFGDGAFDVTVSIYLFHELPPRVRPIVAREMARITKPGGLVVFADSLQAGDSPRLDGLLEAFPDQFHEPYYAHYTRDDLDKRFTDAGLIKQTQTHAFLTKVIAWRKPE